MKKTVKRHWDHLEYYPHRNCSIVILSCGHQVVFNHMWPDEGGRLLIPPKGTKYDCSLCPRSWKDNLPIRERR